MDGTADALATRELVPGARGLAISMSDLDSLATDNRVGGSIITEVVGREGDDRVVVTIG